MEAEAAGRWRWPLDDGDAPIFPTANFVPFLGLILIIIKMRSVDLFMVHRSRERRETDR